MLPGGSARYVPNSPEWMVLLEERAERADAKKSKKVVEPLGKKTAKGTPPKAPRGRGKPKKM